MNQPEPQCILSRTMFVPLLARSPAAWSHRRQCINTAFPKWRNVGPQAAFRELARMSQRELSDYFLLWAKIWFSRAGLWNSVGPGISHTGTWRTNRNLIHNYAYRNTLLNQQIIVSVNSRGCNIISQSNPNPNPGGGGFFFPPAVHVCIYYYM